MPDQPDRIEHPFGPTEEESVISLIIDKPELFTAIGMYLKKEHFQKAECRFVYGLIEEQYAEHTIIPTRSLLVDLAARNLKADDDIADYVIELVKKDSDPREMPIIRDTLLEWVRGKAYGLLFSEASFSAYEQGDYEKIEEIVEDAQKITDTSKQGLIFFDNIDKIFEEKVEERFTSGFQALDSVLNEGGPTRGETLVYMAPTGVGKSIMLVNAGVANFYQGRKVLHITLELSEHKTQLRYAGVFTDLKVNKERYKNKAAFEGRLRKIKNSGAGDLRIYQFPPDEISVNHIYTLLEQLRRLYSWKPDVIIVDYLELMRPRRKSDDKEYNTQKNVSTELRGLGINTETYIITATQTNRSSNEGADKDGNGGPIGIEKVAESYGKMMATDYVVSINQSKSEYNGRGPEDNNQGYLRLFVAKNRNGEKFKTVNCTVNYNTFKVKEDTSSPVI